MTGAEGFLIAFVAAALLAAAAWCVATAFRPAQPRRVAIRRTRSPISPPMAMAATLLPLEVASST